MPHYSREVWDYGKAQTDLINRAIDQFDWVNLFLSKKINEQVVLFNRTILNILHNFIPNKIILYDDRDEWMNNRIKYLIKKEKSIFQKQKETKTFDHIVLPDQNIMKDLQLNLMIPKPS